MNAIAASPSATVRASRRWLFALAALAVAACGQPVPKALARAGRYGSLRDLVLFERPELGPAEALFVDRFEVTRADWAEFVPQPAGQAVSAGSVPHDGDTSLPVAFVDLRQARAFAQWRFLRLPRSDEWRFVTVGDRNNPFPWGSLPNPMRANTAELGLGRPTPVGTFESGRRAGGDQPYDLVGNVSEWTESIASEWWRDQRREDGGSLPRALDPLGSMRACRRDVLAAPALATWQGPGGLVPLAWLVAAGGDYVPREVVGADFQSRMEEGELVEAVLAGDRRVRTGFRLCATAADLLLALGAERAVPAAADDTQLRRFVRRGRHRDALLEAWRAIEPAQGDALDGGPVAAILREELGFAPAGGH